MKQTGNTSAALFFGLILLFFAISAESRVFGAAGAGRHYYLFPYITAGVATSSQDPRLSPGLHRGHLSGTGAGLHIANHRFGLDLTLGWTATVVKVKASADLLGTSERIPSAIETSFGEATVTGRYKLSNTVALGPGFLYPFGSDTGFAPEKDSINNQGMFLGMHLSFSPLVADRFRKGHVRFGFQIWHDVNINERQIMFFRASADYQIPLSVPPKIVYREKVKTRIKRVLRYKTNIKEKTVPVYQNRYIIDAGVFYFVTGKHNLSPMARGYLEALARLLKQHSNEWSMIYISSHTDKRGGESLNEKLSVDRGREINGIFTQHGINHARITSTSRQKQQPVEAGDSPVSLARNRRAELTISGQGQMKSLKKKILLLQQKFRAPETCSGSSCR